MKNPVFLLLTAAIVLGVLGCKPKADPTPVEGLTVYKDNVRGFEIKIPTNWFKQSYPGDLLVVTTSQGAAPRFANFGTGTAGARIELRVTELDSTRTIDTLVKNLRLQFEDGLDRYKTEPATLGGRQGVKLYVAFDQEDGQYKTESYLAERDGVVTIVTLSAFGATFDDYASTFSEVLSSVKLAGKIIPKEEPKPDTLAPQGPQPPSDTLRPYAAADFAIQIPQNFDGKKSSTAGTLSSMNFVGSRLDCTIQVDVFDASKQKNLDKILEQNKSAYGNKPAASTTLGGAKAGYFSYNPAANIGSRAYFAVKGDKMYRVTVNWYKPEQGVYLPIFEKSLATMTLK